jgi:hypothetical protein
MSMKSRLFASLAVALAASASLAAERQETTNDPPAMAAGAVGAPHRQLATFAGRWNVEQFLWTRPGAAPEVDPGSAEFGMVLGGRHLRQDLRVRSGTPFQGIGYVGFDNASRKYYSGWMDINFTGLLVLTGDYDPASATYTFRGEMPDSAHPGAGVPVRQVMHVVDAGHFTVEDFETRNGKESLVVRLVYTRVQ